MKRARIVILGVVAVALVGSLASNGARANGAPQTDPLTYSGFMEDTGGNPVNGAKYVVIKIWDAAVGGAQLCVTAPGGNTTITNGWFELALDPTCKPVVQQAPETWIEVIADGTSLGRTKIGAVPFAIEAENGVPPGTIVAYGGSVAPPGWLLCDGATASAAQYPRLFAAIGTAWGNGDGGPQSFSVPDLRGRFVRGVDQGSGRDPDAASRLASHAGDAVGSVEGHAFESISTWCRRTRRTTRAAGSGEASR